jgi:hypothetical protein
LNEREKALAVARLVTDEDEKERLTHKQAFVAAVKDVKTWVGSYQLCCQCIVQGPSGTENEPAWPFSRQIFTLVYVLLNGAGTISYFFPTLMTSLGYTGRDAQCE